MKKLIYILVVLVFFFIGSFSLYYLGVISNYYLSIFDNYILDVITTVVILFLFFYLYSLIYEAILINKFNYLRIMIMGFVVGFMISLIVYDLKIEEYIFMILFTSFAFTFISYSIYFERIKTEVFD
jgi:hypothetical protein